MVTLTPRGYKRFAHNHPWIFSNEFEGKITSIEAGSIEPVHAPGGKVIAHAMINPHSLIAGRIWERGAANARPILERIQSAFDRRTSRLKAGLSTRLVFSEADD